MEANATSFLFSVQLDAILLDDCPPATPVCSLRTTLHEFEALDAFANPIARKNSNELPNLLPPHVSIPKLNSSRLRSQTTANPGKKIYKFLVYKISLRPCSVIHQSRASSEDRRTVKATALFAIDPVMQPLEMQLLDGIFDWDPECEKLNQSICKEQVVEEWAPSVGKRVLRGTDVADTWQIRGTT